jgi:hypothetical protein
MFFLVEAGHGFIRRDVGPLQLLFGLRNAPVALGDLAPDIRLDLIVEMCLYRLANYRGAGFAPAGRLPVEEIDELVRELHQCLLSRYDHMVVKWSGVDG